MTFRIIDVTEGYANWLTASTVPETDYASWAAGTTYARGDRVISTTTHRVYESARNSNLGKNPTVRTNRFNPESNPTGWWIDVSATNRWKVLDGRLFDQARQASSMRWTFVTASGINAVGLFGLFADQVRCEVLNGATPISDTTINLAATDGPLRRAAFLGLGATTGRTVRVTVSGSGDVYCGEIVLGQVRDLGAATYGTGEGFASYSRNETDDYGNPVVIRRLRGASAQIQAVCNASDKDRVLRVLAAQDARPAVYMAGDPNAPEGIMVFGYSEAPFITLSGPTKAEYVIDVKGIT